MPTNVYLGNTNPTTSEVDGNAVTLFTVPDGTGLIEAVTSITRAYDGYHSTDPPEWVESENNSLAEAIASNYTYPADEEGERSAHTCQVGKPEGWVGADPRDELVYQGEVVDAN